MVKNHPLTRTPSKRKKQLRWNRIAFIGIIGACLTAVIVAGINIYVIQAEYAAARNEYASLRRDYAPLTHFSDAENGMSPAGDGTSTEPAHSQSPGMNLAELNSDYVGWIKIGDTPVDYPIVQGKDNEKYLDTSFLGTRNKAGAIFLDIACTDGLDSAHTILYGHNMKDESMFGSLSKYLDDAYRSLHPHIQIIMPQGDTRIYQILSARITNVFDTAYQWDDADVSAVAASLGASEDTQRLLTLSTCTNDDPNERLLLHAAQTEITYQDGGE